VAFQARCHSSQQDFGIDDDRGSDSERIVKAVGDEENATSCKGFGSVDDLEGKSVRL
jgi:hypothetical protein